MQSSTLRRLLLPFSAVIILVYNAIITTVESDGLAPLRIALGAITPFSLPTLLHRVNPMRRPPG